MSGAVSLGGAATDYGLYGQLLSDSTAAELRVNALTQQAASGYISGTYAGLGQGARIALNLAPQVAEQKTLSQNVGIVNGRLGVTQNALTQITQAAQAIFAELPNLNGINASEVDSVAAQARQALQTVAGALNSQDGATYVFSGQDSINPPVPSGSAILSSGFFTQIQAAVAGLAAAGASATAASTLAIASSNAAGTTPFSAFLSTAAASGTDVRPTVETGVAGVGARVPAGIVANANSDIVSLGISTTGSYTRDILRALATIGSLSSTQLGAAGFGALVQNTQTSLGGAITAIASDAGALGVRQNQLTALGAATDATVTALSAQVSNAQDADLAQVSTQLSQAQTQLQASFQLIAGVNKLSLVNYL